MRADRDARKERAHLRDVLAYRVNFAVRSERRYQEHLDWVEIVGRMLHPTYERTPMSQGGPVATLAGVGLPQAVQVAELVIGPTQLSSWVSRARCSLAPGWLWGRLRELNSQARDRSADVIGDATKALDPWADTSTWSTSSRLAALELARSGATNRLVRQHVAEQARAALLHGFEDISASLEVREVHQGGADDQSLPPIGAWRQEPSNLAGLAAAVRPSVVRIAAADGGGSGVVDGPRMIATNARVVSDSDTVDVLLFDNQVVTGRVHTRSSTTDLALVSVDVELAHPPEFADWGVVEQGLQFLSLGYPQLLDGEPTLSWGLLSATDRIISTETADRLVVFQHDAYISGGSSGSPVFASEARLIGVNAAGHPEANYICFAIPVRELALLLDDAAIPATEIHAAGPAQPSEAFADFCRPPGPTGGIPVEGSVWVTSQEQTPTFGRPLRWQWVQLVLDELVEP